MASRVLRCGKPDVRRQHAVRQARERLLGGVRVNRAQAAEMAGVQRLQQVERLGAAHLADQDAIGPMTERGAEQVGDRDRRQRRLLSERRLSAPRFEAQHVRLVEVDLGGLLDDDDAIASGMWAASALSSVVFPVPVPPEIRMFCCVATACDQLRMPVPVSARQRRPARRRLYRRVNFRMVSAGPATAHGGNIAATREPSSSRASSSGCMSEISSPQARAMFLIATVRFRVSSVRAEHGFEGAVALDEHAPAAVVHHHLGDGRDRASRSSIGLRNGRMRSRLLIAHLAPRDRSSWSARRGSAASGSRTAAAADSARRTAARSPARSAVR